MGEGRGETEAQEGRAGADPGSPGLGQGTTPQAHGRLPLGPPGLAVLHRVAGAAVWAGN